MSLAELATRTFAPADLAGFIDLLDADFSPAADVLVYAVNTRDGVTTAEQSVLWAAPLSGGPATVLHPAEGSQTSPVLSPDGRSVAWLQEIDGHPQLVLLDRATDHLQVLTDVARGVAGMTPAFTPDGLSLVFAACDDPPRDVRRPYRITRPVWRRDGMGLVEDVRAELHVVATAGGPSTRLTFHDGIAGGAQVSPDGRSVLYGCFAEPGSVEFALRITALPTPVAGGDGQPAAGTPSASDGAIEVMRGSYLAYPPAAAWLPDGRVVHTTAWNVNSALDLIVFDPATGVGTARGVTVRGQIHGGLQPAMNGGAILGSRLIVDPTGSFCLLHVQDGGRLDTCAVALDGPATVTVIAPSTASTVPVALKGSTLLLARTSFTAPLDLMVVDLPADLSDDSGPAADAADVRRLTKLNPRLAEAPFTVLPLAFTGTDGTPVEGWFLRPAGTTGPVPTVLNIHGGPFSGHGEMFSLEDHLFAAAGLGVLSINFRGSSGYGEEFAAPLWADWGHHDAGDLLAGLDAAVGQGWVEPDRVGSFGLSGGGYMTSWLLTHSDRFRAGVAECPVTDWHAMVGSDIPQLVALWMGGEPGHGPESMAEYARAAPSTHAAACTTPMLVIVHEADLRCPPGQGDILYNALRMAGCEVEMLRLPGMSHVGVYGVADLPGRIGRAEALLDWFTERLLG